MIYQFRTRRKNDTRKWENVPVDLIKDCADGMDAYNTARDSKQDDPTIKEIRYNEKGSQQGYYC